MAEQTYFTAAGFRFLRELKKHNERAWFNDNKARYESVVRDPFLRLIGDLAAPLAKISAHFRADPRPSGGSMFRISRYSRFAMPMPPNKTWLGARVSLVRPRQVHAPLF